ncbi:hypothetical protein ACF064_32605 [Streptomyces sp. NPDC015492]|uniref:hypothetical protein n=1 Tax=Streptomyces sp. NPDC015492 TaxID=3364958 RepID=UPI0036F5BD6E
MKSSVRRTAAVAMALMGSIALFPGNAHAATPKEFVVKVVYENIEFGSDECDISEYNCAEVYGKLTADNSASTTTRPALEIGTADEEDCPSPVGVVWEMGEYAGACHRYVDNVRLFEFAKTATRSCTKTVCDGAWKKNNREIEIRVKPGQSIDTAAKFYDDDDDVLCNAAYRHTYTSEQMKTLNGAYTVGNSAGGWCEVNFRMYTTQVVY